VGMWPTGTHAGGILDFTSRKALSFKERVADVSCGYWPAISHCAQMTGEKNGGTVLTHWEKK